MADGELNFTREDSGDVSFGPSAPAVQTKGERPHQGNISERMSENDRMAISEAMTENIAFDEDGQVGQDDISERITDLMGLNLDGEADSDDELSDTSSHTLMLTAVLRFQAKALSALLPADDMAVRTKPVVDLEQIKDKKQREKVEEELSRAERRVQAFYTDYLFKKLPSYEDDTDQILSDMGMHGLGVRKIVVDRSRKGTPVRPEIVRKGELIVSYDTKNFRTGRLTHKMDVTTGDLIRRINAGMYRPVKVSDQGMPDISPITQSRDRMYGFEGGHYQATETHRVYEVYADLFLNSDPHPDGLPRPYIVTIHAQTQEVLSIQRNWKQMDPDETAMEHFVGYLFHPGRSGVTGVGLGQILMQTTLALRTAQRRMLEAGYLQNHPSGFKLSSMSIRDGETKIRAGEFVDVDSPTGDIRQSLMLHPFQGPSQGLMALSATMLQAGQELGGIATIDFAQLMKSGVAAGPAMAAFEESTEFQTAVHRRLYKGHRTELEIIHDRMRTVMGEETVLFGVDQHLQKGDLTAVDILPYMKPGQASKQRSVMEAEAIWGLAKESPDIVSKREAAVNYIHALGSPDADRMILPDAQEEEVKPADAVTEYNMLLAGRPIKAGMMQNHQAHIDTHAAQLKIIQMSQMPLDQGDAASAVLASHIAEHMGMQMMVEVSQMTGIPLEQMGPDVPPEMEAQMAPLVAKAVMQLEETRRPPEQVDNKLQIEQMKQQGAAEREKLKLGGRQTEAQMKQQFDAQLKEAQRQFDAQNEEAKRQHAIDLRKLQDDAAMDREIQDNATALQIAQLKQSGGANSDAGAGASSGARAGSSAGARAGVD